ncbi:tRNA pseudouridine(55) synthase TruB [Buchnera aphidicola (Muscaphis stroyani)]|uniref:tRNA pseudouridine synthase B n=1 Tax=Buchnera aphidicola (Muscaphis stroyani) TaxID=1241869 RepID=A0A4D6YG11_9GAMM|nr:tRNA pseudouridine(55) synthase TruB [Buchnera aphidicola]QCI24650.1 tRNA pseudouridine(55) synthase TruB [Buchnera aphidicola (Muscaphis stroyani)]
MNSRKKRDIHGFFLLDKPKGISSNYVLQEVKLIFNAKKAGYIGTLDPLATGMLPICFGESTKFSYYSNISDKKYHVIAKLGETTSTSDASGAIIKKRPILFSSHDLDASIKKFTGCIYQIPPMHSAIKHNGIPLYKYARKGLQINRNSRRVYIHKIEFLSYEKNLIEFIIVCSKGTYIRTLIEDLGENLGCGAHVANLRRLQVATYSYSKLVTISDLYKLLNIKHIKNIKFFKKIDELLMPIDSPVSFFPKVYLSCKKSYNFKSGQSVIFDSNIKKSLVRVFEEENNKFLGLGRINVNKLLIPHRLISEIHS